ncbi:2-dehydropantoate 2-reductase N-terminal domain-containing protein [Agrobacterium tumefaciens]|uniref:ketopantoate reductase family protein n=1 Tax=Agrobacterium tumefaciens TaxID=358 RepID=UPI00287E6673|nr:2-dehydropantoate 2-reductase N-terminal domain-containing protein [Agrobacterium tumefaciens]MDS7596987.1 ketopantoate reductase family protein [Agrobacterium tumefaciens]
MTRYIIVGAGAIGASLAAQFELTGINYALIGRGAQIEHIRKYGLRFQRPSGARQLSLNAFDVSSPPELTSDDVLLLTVKSQDAVGALAFWSWRPIKGERNGVAASLPIVTFQNGLATEAAALRAFSRVYGASILTPARFTKTGEVVVGGDPQLGIVTIGRFPAGRDATSERIVADLTLAGYLAESSADIRRWKSAKLLHNVKNVLELFDGAVDLKTSIGESLVAEARDALQAAGYTFASPAERAVDISNWKIAPNSGIQPGQQSTWQSFTRGASSEVDYLNGEIVLLGRLHGVPTPYNEAVQVLTGKLEHGGGFSGALPLQQVQALVDSSDQARQPTRVSAV